MLTQTFDYWSFFKAGQAARIAHQAGEAAPPKSHVPGSREAHAYVDGYRLPYFDHHPTNAAPSCVAA